MWRRHHMPKADGNKNDARASEVQEKFFKLQYPCRNPKETGYGKRVVIAFAFKFPVYYVELLPRRNLRYDVELTVKMLIAVNVISRYRFKKFLYDTSLRKALVDSAHLERSHYFRRYRDLWKWRLHGNVYGRTWRVHNLNSSFSVGFEMSEDGENRSKNSYQTVHRCRCTPCFHPNQSEQTRPCGATSDS